MNRAVDFEEICEGIESYAPPMPGDSKPHRIDPTDMDSVTEAMDEMMRSVVRDTGYGTYEECRFIIHPETRNEVALQDIDIAPMALGKYRGSRVLVELSMPEDIILYMPLDAVTIGGGVVLEPRAISYAHIGGVLDD